MKQQQSIALSAIIAVAIGLSGMGVLVDASSTPEINDTQLLAEKTGIAGHMEVVQTNADGEVIAYRQTDNAIMTTGFECIMEIALAGAAIASNTCPITTISGAQFDTVQLIASGSAPLAADTVGATTPVIVGAIAGLELTDGGCTYTDGTSAAICTATFTGGSAINQAVAGAYLADDATPEAYFAGSLFTSVTMTEADVLTVTWTISFS